ncbi:MAG: DUF4442 domain-containing protein [Myxococcales bacterium]
MVAVPQDKAGWMKALWTNPVGIRALLWQKLPLAAFAGLRVRKLDAEGGEVSLPAGWRTQNPFRSTYFAAQAMAAELSTGAPAMIFVEESGARMSMLVTGLTARFTKKATRTVTFAFADGARMKAAIDEAARTGEAVALAAKTIGTQDDGAVVAEFEIAWSFKRKKG